MPNTLLLEVAAPSQDNYAAAQNDLSSLRYELKKVESNRRSDHAKILKLLKKQSQIKIILERERNEMKKNLNLLRARGLLVEDRKDGIHLKKLLGKQESYRADIEEKKRTLKELTNQITAARERLLEVRKTMDVSKDEDKAKRFERKVELLESRLNKAVCTYDELRQKNAAFREEINDMLWSRAKFFYNYSKVKHLINAQKQNIKELIGCATFAYNIRDEAKHRIHVLKERTELDHQKLNEEMKSLHRVVEHDKNLCTFLQRRNKERLSLTSKKMEDSPFRDIKELEEKVNSYRDIFESVAEVVGTRDVNKMIEIYHKAEEENFAKFGLVNEINSEVEKLHAAIKGLHGEISDIQSVLQDLKEKGRRSEEDFKSVLERLNSDVADLEKGASVNSDTLQHMKNFIKKLYDKTQKYFGPEHRYVESTVGVANHNVLEYIEVLELRVVGLLNCYMFLKYANLQEEAKDETLTAVQRSASLAASDLLSRLRESFDSSSPHIDTEPHKVQDSTEITKVFFDSDELREMSTASLQKQHKGK